MIPKSDRHQKYTRNEHNETQSTRTKAITDLSNINLPSYNDTPALTVRKMARLAKNINIANCIYLMCFILLFLTKVYIFTKFLMSEKDIVDQWLEIFDVFLMLGTIINFFLLTAQYCFKKAFLLFALIYGIVSISISVVLYFHHEKKKEEEHILFIQRALLLQSLCTILSVIFIAWVLVRYTMIEREAKSRERPSYLERDYMAANFSIAIGDKSI